MLLRQLAQSLSGELRSHIPLRRSQQFEANHKFSDRGGAQQGRKKVSVKVPLRMFAAVGGALMKAHRVRERNPEQIIVAGGQALEYVGEREALGIGKGDDIGYVTFAQQ